MTFAWAITCRSIIGSLEPSRWMRPSPDVVIVTATEADLDKMTAYETRLSFNRAPCRLDAAGGGALGICPVSLGSHEYGTSPLLPPCHSSALRKCLRRLQWRRSGHPAGRTRGNRGGKWQWTSRHRRLAPGAAGDGTSCRCNTQRCPQPPRQLGGVRWRRPCQARDQYD